MLDLNSDLDISVPVALGAKLTGTVNGATVSLSNNVSAVLSFQFSTVTDGTHTPSVEESADGTVWTAVDAADLTALLTAVTSTESDTVQTVGYKGAAGNIRPVLVTAGATTGGVAGVTAVLGGRKHTGGSPIIA